MAFLYRHKTDRVKDIHTGLGEGDVEITRNFTIKL